MNIILNIGSLWFCVVWPSREWAKNGVSQQQIGSSNTLQYKFDYLWTTHAIQATPIKCGVGWTFVFMGNLTCNIVKGDPCSFALQSVRNNYVFLTKIENSHFNQFQYLTEDQKQAGVRSNHTRQVQNVTRNTLMLIRTEVWDTYVYGISVGRTVCCSMSNVPLLILKELQNMPRGEQF